MTQLAEVGPDRPTTFWDSWPWRRWLGILAVLSTVGFAVAAFVLPPSAEILVTRFIIPPYAYVCLALAVGAVTELPEPRAQRAVMGVSLVAIAVLNVFTYAVEGPNALLIAAPHMGMLVGWLAWRRRFGWTLLWLAEMLAWVALAVAQGRLP